jgi:hypothetical protein
MKENKMNLPKILHPVFEVEVPSTKEKIKMRPMLVREEKILLMAREGDEKEDIISAIKQVVNNCLETEIDLDKIALVDVEYLFLRLRSMSVSNTTKVSYIDNDERTTNINNGDEPEKAAAKATYTFDVDFDKVVVKFPEKMETDIKVSDKVSIVMRYPPASLYSNKEFLASEGQKLVDILVSESIDKIYDGKDITDVAATKKPDKDLNEWLSNLDIKTYDKIRTFLNDLPTLSYDINYTNKNGKEVTIKLTTLNDFFMLA